MIRPISHIQRDIAENRRYVAAGGEVATGSLASLEAELRATTGRRPVRSNKAWPVSVTRCPDCRTSGIAGTRCKCPLTPKAPARHYSLPELRQRAHAITDAFLRDDPEYLMRAEYGQVRDAALRAIETKGAHLSPTAQDRLEDLCRTRTGDVDGKAISRHVVITSSDAYVRAFAKSLAGYPVFDADETAAVNAYRQIAPRATVAERAASEGGSFGLAVPVMISPEITISAVLDDAPILGFARTVVTTTDNWKGIASAGSGFTLPGEGNAVADNSPTFTQPAIQIFSLKDFVPFSIEISQDMPDFVGEMTRLFTADYADRISLDTAIGAGGTAAPMGVFTRMAATTAGSGAAHVTVTTAGSICAADVRAVWQAVPERAKNDPSCCWLMSNSVWSQIAALGAPSVTNGLEPGAVQYPVGNAGPRLFGEPVIFASAAPAFTGTSGTASYLVVGAFAHYAVAQRILGLTVELVPQMFDFAGGTGRPTGSRGFLAVARFGADVLDTSSLRLLSNS
jgi:HK97 family phage major capsid protein